MLRRGRLSFGARLVVALVAILLLMQAATLLIIDVAVDRAVNRQLAARLDVGDRVWHQLQVDRGNELTQAVSALASDFAFREAVATGYASTVLSALLNHGQRIGADASLLLAGDGSVLAGTLDGDPAVQAKALAPLLAAASEQGSSADQQKDALLPAFHLDRRTQDRREPAKHRSSTSPARVSAGGGGGRSSACRRVGASRSAHRKFSKAGGGVVHWIALKRSNAP